MGIEILILAGDGIGPEITAATQQILEATDKRLGLGLSFRMADIGFKALEQFGTTFPQHVVALAKQADGTVLGPVSHNIYPPRDEGGLNPSGELRKQLDLYANIRPARSLEGAAPPCGRPLDLVVVRENTEGFYSDRSMFMGLGEFMPTADLALSVRKVSRHASMRIARKGFELAQQRRKKVTVVHKGNVLRISDGLFLECTRAVAKEYPEVEVEEQLVDAMAALLVRDGSRYDVIVTTNMFGDILSDLASELSGSIGLAASINTNDSCCVAQAQHGSAPDIAGLNKANPSSLIGSAAMMLRWLGEQRGEPTLVQGGGLIQRALEMAVSRPETRTADLGGMCSTTEFTNYLVDFVLHEE